MPHEKPGDVDPRVSNPDGRIKVELTIGERVGWGNLFQIAANFQNSKPSEDKEFGYYFGDANSDGETRFTREIGIHPFLSDVSGRPQAILLNVYLDTEHTQFFVGAAVWGNKGPEVRSVIDSFTSEYLPDKALNRLQAAEWATKIILIKEAEIIGMTGEDIMEGEAEEAEATQHPIKGIRYVPPVSDRLN